MRLRPSALLLTQRFLLSVLVVLSIPLATPSSSAPGQADPRQQPPQRWEVSINLKTDGDYRLDEGGPNFSGHYSFAIHWTGWLEKDDEDYLLTRCDCRLIDWEIQETASLTEPERVLTTRDFQDRPTFILKYFIRDGEDLHLDFIVDRLAVPQASPEDAFALLLPSSEQNGQRESQVDYNACVVKGSNRVELPESAIYAGPVAKTFAWSWKHQRWVPKERRTVFNSQSHKVEVRLSILPCYSRR